MHRLSELKVGLSLRVSYETEQRQFDENVNANLTDSPKLPTGFSENYMMGIGQTIDQSLSISESFVRGFDIPFYGHVGGDFNTADRDEELRSMRKSGLISDDEWMSFVTPDNRGIKMPDYSAMAEYENRKHGTNFKTNKEVDAEMRDAVKRRREIAQSTFDRQSGVGFMGEFAGSLHGYVLEPAGLAAIPLEAVMLGRAAYQLSQAATRLGRAAMVGGIVGSANMATEAAIQPIVFNWHEDIGVDMTWGDALTNIVSVGVMTAGVAGIAKGTKFKRTFEAEQKVAKQKQEFIKQYGKTAYDDVKAIYEKPTGEKITASQVATLMSLTRKTAKTVADDPETEAYLKHYENELNSVPKNVKAEEHFENVAAAESRVNDATPSPVKEEEIDYVIDDSVLDKQFEAMMKDNLEMQEITMRELDDSDIGLDYFGLDDVVRAGKADVQNAIGQIEKRTAKLKQAETCLLGQAI